MVYTKVKSTVCLCDSGRRAEVILTWQGFSKGQFAPRWKADVGFLTAHPMLILTQAALSLVRICSLAMSSCLKNILFP